MLTSFAKYIKRALGTEPKPEHYALIQRETTSHELRVLHAAMGLVTESAEILDLVKRRFFYRAPIDEIKMKLESGDLLWYLALLFDCYGFSLPDICERNIAKLKARYPSSFTEESAIYRDETAEEQAGLGVSPGRHFATTPAVHQRSGGTRSSLVDHFGARGSRASDLKVSDIVSVEPLATSDEARGIALTEHGKERVDGMLVQSAQILAHVHESRAAHPPEQAADPSSQLPDEDARRATMDGSITELETLLPATCPSCLRVFPRDADEPVDATCSECLGY